MVRANLNGARRPWLRFPRPIVASSWCGGPNLRKVDPAIAPISTANGVLGMPGMTAYTGPVSYTHLTLPTILRV